MLMTTYKVYRSLGTEQLGLENTTGENMKEQKTMTEFGTLNESVNYKESESFELLKAGTYVCKYVGTQKRQNETGETYYIHKWEELNSKKWVTEISSPVLTTKSKLSDICRACGLNPKDGINLKDLIGKRCLLFVDVENGFNVVKTHAPMPQV